MATLSSTTKIVVTKSGLTYTARPSAMANNLSWDGIQAVLAKADGKPVTVAELVTGIQAANPENKGNAPAFVNYMVNNGKLAIAK